MSLLKDTQYWFDALTLRERALILITLIVFLLLPGYVLLIEPVLIEQKSLQMKIDRLQSSNKEKRQDINTVRQQSASLGDSQLNSERQQLRDQLGELQQQQNANLLVSPAQANQILNALLQSQADVSVLGVSKQKGIPVLIEQPRGEDESDIHGLYQHAIDISLQGETQALIAYLDRIEQLPEKIFIDQVRWQYGKGQSAEMQIRLHTLGSSEDWLGGQP